MKDKFPTRNPFSGAKSRIVITCAKGVPPFLKEEILSLGLPLKAEGKAEVETEGSLEDAMRLNLFLRTGQRVLFELAAFKARNPDELYARVFQVPWEIYIPGNAYLCVTSFVENPSIRDTRFANLKCKDAVVDRMKKRLGRRPDSGPERTGVVVDLYWRGADCRVYLDTSGEPLSRRGYRKIPLQAPLQETLAAAIVLATGWRGRGNFINPMCGSGTLAIEAASIGINRAPGLLRENFSFMHLVGFNRSFWKGLLKKAREAETSSPQGKIAATDIDAQALRAARKNAAAAQVDEMIDFQEGDFAQTPVPPGEGVVVLNPEYGERLGEEEKLAPTYRRIGDFFKQRCLGYRGYVFTGNLKLAREIGLRAGRRIPFFNGGIECRLLEFELYSGSRRNPGVLPPSGP